MRFCDELYESCKSAEYMGKTIGKEYKSGREFCRAQDFTIIENNRECFEFDPTPFSVAVVSLSVGPTFLLLMSLFCVLLFN
jgi:hypothetical protein